MKELDLVVEPDSDLNDKLAQYPLPMTYAESTFLLDMFNIPERITKYGNYCYHVKDVFVDYDSVYDFVQKIPYTYNKDLNAAAYLYRSSWQLPEKYGTQLSQFVSEVTDLPNNIKERCKNGVESNGWVSSFFTKAWYDLHYIEMAPHQDNAEGGLFDITKPLVQGKSIQYVMLIYMNDGFGTSIYKNNDEESFRREIDIESGKLMTNFNYINLAYNNDWKHLYKEVLTSPGQKNSAFIFPANCPHRVSRYKADTPVEEFEKHGRFYLMKSFELEFI